MIEIKKLHKSFKKLQVLKGIDLTINDGEVVGIIDPVVVVAVVLEILIDRMLIDVGVVAGDEEAELCGELQTPAGGLGLAQRHDVTDAEAAAEAFAFPSVVSVEADAVETGVEVALEEEAAERHALARRILVDAAAAEVVARLELVVANLEELMEGFNENPPCAIPLKVAYGAAEFDPSVDKIEEQVRISDERMYEMKVEMKALRKDD